ncbi:uncharacterized protein FOMMEDRAFT_28277 [Fomitiporia mediterranea MF3/22]|uniref:uncharacterized protein n=1 Tax=Fomitiporia mediterranea (strain MF3/22) TaxID=694068 RepID=UPI0004408E31|nr:uncharacterized protein FOMMEDRAFT_28277 [Fomitiporia mediterranea MF3/22]EJD04633.1 hypothetical protein FOMMEDRAFT_28277 [Fomitiporia mediterranea MF3/22]
MSSWLVRTLELNIYAIQLTKLMSESSLRSWEGYLFLGPLLDAVRHTSYFFLMFQAKCLSWIRFHWVAGVVISFLAEGISAYTMRKEQGHGMEASAVNEMVKDSVLYFCTSEETRKAASSFTGQAQKIAVVEHDIELENMGF